MEFDVLKDLVQAITRNKVKQIEVLGNPGNEGSRVEEFYQLLSDGQLQTEEEAVQHFFKTDNVKDSNYRKLRNKLIRQLINTSFFVDINQPMFDERTKAQYNCYRDFSAAYILMTREARRAGIYLLHQVLEQAIKYEFVDLCAEITRYLRVSYSKSVNDAKNHQKFTLLHRAYEEKRSHNVRIVDAYETLLEYYMQKHAPSKTVYELASGYVAEFKPLRKQISLSQFDYYAYSIELIQFYAANDIRAVARLADEALGALQDNPNITKARLFGIAIQKMSSVAQLKEADDAQILLTINQCLGFTEEGRFNWFVIWHNAIYCYTHHRLYKKAFEAFKTGYEHKRFRLQSVRMQEEWRLIGAYLNLLVELGELPQAEVEAAVGTYKSTKFENDFTELSRDKEGMNIPIVILPAVFALAKSDFEAFEAQIDKLDKYRKRYLENELNQRSARFLQMMFALAKQKYGGSVRSEGRLRQEVEKLHALTPQVARQHYAIEVIPYENLWELLVRKLEP